MFTDGGHMCCASTGVVASVLSVPLTAVLCGSHDMLYTDNLPVIIMLVAFKLWADACVCCVV